MGFHDQELERLRKALVRADNCLTEAGRKDLIARLSTYDLQLIARYVENVHGISGAFLKAANARVTADARSYVADWERDNRGEPDEPWPTPFRLREPA